MTTSQQNMETFLPSIEDPEDPVMKQVYEMTRQQWGKVLTPVKVFSARMSPEFVQFAAMVAQLDQKLTLPRETAYLVRERVANITICSFCIDIGRAVTIKSSMNEAKFDALEEYRTSPLFTDSERAALDHVTELTKNRSTRKPLHAWPNTIQSAKSARSSGLSLANTSTI
jgi:alkylhydroperoxidase family enzyme